MLPQPQLSAGNQNDEPAAPPPADAEVEKPSFKLLHRVHGSLPDLSWLKAAWNTPVRTSVNLLIALLTVTAVVRLFPVSPVQVWRQVFPPDGYIFVDSPEVYTRERLINERLKEDLWLNKKLDEADDDKSLVGISRIINENIAIGGGSAEKDGGSAAPASVPAAAENQAATLTFDQKLRIKSANRDFVLQKIIENRLDDRHDLNGNSLYILKFDTTVVSSQFSNRKALVTIELVPPVKNISSKDNQSDAAAINLLLDEQSVTALGKAYRRFKDDTVDRLNNALQKSIGDNGTGALEQADRLKDQIVGAIATDFGVRQADVIITRIPSPRREICRGIESAAATARCEVWNLEINAIHKYVAFRANVQIDNDMARVPNFLLQERVVEFELSRESCASGSIMSAATGKSCDPDTQYRIRTRAHDASLATALSAFENAKRCGTPVFSTPIDGYDLFSDPSTAILDEEKIFAIMTDAVTKLARDRRTTLFASWGNLRINGKDKYGCTHVAGTLDKGFLDFIKKVGEYNSYSYSVLPRQSAVSVIDEIVSSASARLAPAGKSGLVELTGIGDLAMGSHQKLSGASLRSSITAFGYALEAPKNDDGSVEIGWIIDPAARRLRAEGDGMDTTTESVLAIISVPAWWPNVQVRINRRWLNSNGTMAAAHAVDALHGVDTGESSAATDPPSNVTNPDSPDKLMTVDLPNSQGAIEDSLVTADKRIPSIAALECQLKTKEGTRSDASDQSGASDVSQQRNVVSCIIRGKRLWRNTIVTLGTTQHESLLVLPNMEGLIAEFPLSSIRCSQSIRVWTSEGVAEEKRDQQNERNRKIGCNDIDAVALAASRN